MHGSAASLDPTVCNMSDFVLERCREQPDRAAIVADDETLSFAAFGALVQRLRHGLNAAGLKPGQRVVSTTAKTPETIALFFATLASGAIYVPANPALTEQEIELIVADSGASFLITDSGDSPGVPGTAQRLGLDHLADAPGTPPLPVVGGGDDPAVMLFTSGTTGRPKGSVQTHRNLATSLTNLAHAWAITPADTLLHVLPVYHGHGLFLAAACPLMAGAGLRLLPKFDLARVLELLPQATVFMAVPTIHARLLASPEFTSEHCRNLRLVTSGSAPLPPDVSDAVFARTGIRILERYGSTESGMITSNLLNGTFRRGSVGPAFEDVELRVVDPEGHDVAPGEVGRLLVRSPYVGLGYWQPDGTIVPIVDADGYFDTEDLVRLDDDGYLFIVGRVKDLIISGGLNIYPREVEIALEGLPGIGEAVVVGVPHPDFGEAVLAVVVPKAGAALNDGAVAEALSAKLTSYKRPKRIEVVDALPRNDMGKIVKRALAERYRDVFNP